MPEYSEQEYLAGFARCAGAHVVAAGDEGPITRRAWPLLNDGRPEPPPIAPDDILRERAVLLEGVEENDCMAVLPETVALIDTEGRVHHLEVDGLDAAHLLAAEISEAACAVLLSRALAARAARIAGLERLRRMRLDLEHAEEAI